MLAAACAVALLLAAAYAGAIALGLRRRRVDIWWRDYRRHLRERGALRAQRAAKTTDVLFCFVDHYEPRWGNCDYATELRRVARWVSDYPRLCEGHRDADGCAPKHTFFFPSEEYRAEHLDPLVALCAQGYGEIEIHLHHDNDTEAGLRANLETFLGQLTHRHDALPVDPATGKPLWSFIHGNWALDNSRDDGRWCGVNNELTILREMGCYADFTLPSAPSDTQTSTVNSIYYATDDPACPKSHDTGTPVRVGGNPSGDLMIIQGPLGLRWKRRAILPVPAIENGDIRTPNPPTRERIDTWIDTGIHVEGRPEWVFVKVHTHGAQERDADALLGRPVAEMFEHLERHYNDGKRHRLHYVSAREMYNIARAAEAGKDGDAGRYRDFVIPRPGYRQHAEPAAAASVA
jgi:hypothetical protein